MPTLLERTDRRCCPVRAHLFAAVRVEEAQPPCDVEWLATYRAASDGGRTSAMVNVRRCRAIEDRGFPVRSSGQHAAFWGGGETV